MRVRVLSYNIRHGQGVGGVLSNRRIATVIESSGCDVAGLNEVWRVGARYDQPEVLGRLTGLSTTFHQLVHGWRREAGNLLLSRLEVSAVRELFLVGGGEPRGCLIVDVTVSGQPSAFALTHLSLQRRTRADQIAQLVGDLPRDRPLVLLGDFNCEPRELEP
jgi:endonuclease/exonuclease/phosphatase family metal-dependent hydrolase